MENVWVLAAVWVGLALIATLIADWFKISTASSEIVVGSVAQLVIGAFFVQSELSSKTPWITFLAGTGAIASWAVQRSLTTYCIGLLGPVGWPGRGAVHDLNSAGRLWRMAQCLSLLWGCKPEHLHSYNYKLC